MPPPKFKREGASISYKEDQYPLPTCKFEERWCISYQDDQCPLPKFEERWCISYQEDQRPLLKFKGGGISYQEVQFPLPKFEGRGCISWTNPLYLNSKGRGHIIPRPMPPPKFKRERAYSVSYQEDQCPQPKFEGRGCISWTNAST